MPDSNSEQMIESYGRPLDEWLRELLDADAAVQDRALQVLFSLSCGIGADNETSETPDVELLETRRDAFVQSLRQTVADKAFPGAELIRRLVAEELESHHEWMRINKGLNAEFDAVLERVQRSRQADPSPRNQERQAERLRQAFSDDEKHEQALQAVLMKGVHCSALLAAMGPTLLIAPDAVRTLLKDDQHRDIALKAIEQAGPAAASQYLSDLMTDAPPAVAEGADSALAAVGRGDSRVVGKLCAEIDRVLALAQNAGPVPPTASHEFHELFYGKDAGWRAAGTLASMGPPVRTVADVGENVLPRLLLMTHSPLPGQRAAAAMALGSCAQGDAPEVIDQVVSRLLGMTKDHPWVAGRAIDSLGKLRAHPQRVVPRLIELFDEFEEFDPDEGYYGSHARVCRALTQYGNFAAMVLPRIIRELEKEAECDDPFYELTTDLFEILRTLGPQAAAALPALRKLHEKAPEEQRIIALLEEIRP